LSVFVGNCFECNKKNGLLKLSLDTQFEKKAKENFVKVKQSHYRRGQAQRVPRVLRLPDFKTIGT